MRMSEAQGRSRRYVTWRRGVAVGTRTSTDGSTQSALTTCATPVHLSTRANEHTSTLASITACPYQIQILTGAQPGVLQLRRAQLGVGLGDGGHGQNYMPALGSLCILHQSTQSNSTC